MDDYYLSTASAANFANDVAEIMCIAIAAWEVAVFRNVKVCGFPTHQASMYIYIYLSIYFHARFNWGWWICMLFPYCLNTPMFAYHFLLSYYTAFAPWFVLTSSSVLLCVCVLYVWFFSAHRIAYRGRKCLQTTLLLPSRRQLMRDECDHVYRHEIYARLSIESAAADNPKERERDI